MADARHGLPLATADIFEGRTVAAMAARLDAAAAAVADAPPPGGARLLPLTAAAARPGAPVLVLFHPVGGMVMNYIPVALPELRCLGLQARGIEAGEAPDTNSDAMVARYAEAVRTAVPDERAPLRVCGYSFGGVVAHELMRRLRPAPGPDDLLILIDDLNPAAAASAGPPQPLEGSLAAPPQPPPRSLDDLLLLGLGPTYPRVARLVLPLLPLLPRRAKLALGRRGIGRFLAAAPEALAFQRVSSALVERIVGVWIALSVVLAAVRPRPHPVRALILRASDRSQSPGIGAQVRGWERLVGEVVAERDLPGNHLTMLSVANSPAVAAALRDGLRLASAAA